MAKTDEGDLPLKPKVCILRTDGTNCDEELFYAFEKYGGLPEYVHVNELRTKSKKLTSYQILALPGGFSYGDDIASGKILAVEMISNLRNQLQEFINKKGLIIGICNGFQTLVRTGLLPFGQLGKMDTTLAQNQSGHFECRWIKIKTEKSQCPFIPEGKIAEIAVNHGEGRLFAKSDVIQKIEDENLVVFRYVNGGKPTNHYPENPNGAVNAIAGVCDPTGRILGLMPHPEKFIDTTQHPNWRRPDFQNLKPAFIIENMIDYVKKS